MSEVFSKSDLIETIATDHGLSKSSAKVIIEAAFDTIVSQVKTGKKVALAGFGNFELKIREARTGRNPANGDTIQIAESRSIGFKPAKAAKDKL
ncbi:HU family DNA-binding protein [Nevskia ramosa]|uniref:HU family DNA-binding protein n=1 Tax=Nevskia ramosa TaxID=64002 RepID=UPI002354DC6D|nr:HU family DNA-binding protein [Nevskia ramosa]